ncbi:hypothetical protein N8Z24_00495 [bacterium]|nr:hypothetical protein [bacterium]
MEDAIATCVLTWLYEQASTVLKALRSLLEQGLILIDTEIQRIRALIAQNDAANLLEAYTWGIYEAAIEKIKNGLMSGFQELGPGADICPQFYNYITDPFLALMESSLDTFSIYKDRYFSTISISDEFDRLLVYWTSTKAQITAVLDVLDDALYNALIIEGVNNS